MKINFCLRLSLDDVILESSESDVMKLLLKCRNLSGKNFQVIFWNQSLSKKQCSDFKKRNRAYFHKLNINITDDYSENVWFLIENFLRNDVSSYRYKFVGNLLSGINEYIKIVNHIMRREERNESSNRR